MVYDLENVCGLELCVSLRRDDPVRALYIYTKKDQIDTTKTHQQCNIHIHRYIKPKYFYII